MAMQVLEEASKKSSWRPLPARVLELESQGLQLPTVPEPEHAQELQDPSAPAAQPRKRRCAAACQCSRSQGLL